MGVKLNTIEENLLENQCTQTSKVGDKELTNVVAKHFAIIFENMWN